LFAIARKAKHDAVSRNQMILAIWRANQSAFPGGNINMLEVGTVLAIPSREQVAAIDSAEADRLVREILRPLASRGRGEAGSRSVQAARQAHGARTGGSRTPLSRRGGLGAKRR
jgi:pilus assembly protein FimV